MDKFKIDKNDNGYHIHGESYHWQGHKIIPLYATCKSYEDCIKWLDKNYPSNYELVT